MSSINSKKKMIAGKMYTEVGLGGKGSAPVFNQIGQGGKGASPKFTMKGKGGKGEVKGMPHMVGKKSSKDSDWKFANEGANKKGSFNTKYDM
jgi:hypothetical protein